MPDLLGEWGEKGRESMGPIYPVDWMEFDTTALVNGMESVSIATGSYYEHDSLKDILIRSNEMGER